MPGIDFNSFDYLSDAVVITDGELNPPGPRILHVNRAFTRMTGYDAGEVIGKTPGILQGAKSDQRIFDLARDPLSRGEDVVLEAINYRRDGSELGLEWSIKPVRDKAGRISNFLSIMRDVSERMLTRSSSGGVKRLVSADELRRRLRQVVDSAQKLGSVHTVGVIELERPDPRGVLRRILSSMCQRIRQSDTLAELDGTRYGLILHHCPLDNAIDVAGALLEAIRSHTASTGDDATGDAGTPDGTPKGTPAYRVVIGLVPFSAEARDVGDLLARGRRACAEAWALGGDRVHVFHSEASDRARKEHEILRAVELLQALEHDQLLLYGQEIVPLKQQLMRHVEILMRMPDGLGGVVPPAAFVLAAERYGLAPRLDRWVVDAVLASYRRLFGGTAIGVTINLSGRSVGDDELLDLVRRCLSEHDVPAGRVCFEITETAAISDIDRARSFIHALRQLGCRFALDDFGSGHASFRYLKELEVDYLKIDRGFVPDVPDQDFDLAMVEAMHRIGRVLGIRVVAEGVESREILERLRAIGLDYAQGYVHGRPGPLDELARSFKSGCQAQARSMPRKSVPGDDRP